jgi:hypothetical protein
MTEQPIARILSIDGGGPSEIEYLDNDGNRVGYWAYGSYDPAYPYQGDIPEQSEGNNDACIYPRRID